MRRRNYFSGKLTNRDREQWIDNDEGLYLWRKQSRLSKRAFIQAFKAEIDAVILGVLNRPPRSNPRRKRSKAQEAAPIDKLYRKDRLNQAEHAIIDLAVAIHYSRSKASAVSWKAQVEADAYFRRHGLAKTMDRVVKLGGPYW